MRYKTIKHKKTKNKKTKNKKIYKKKSKYEIYKNLILYYNKS